MSSKKLLDPAKFELRSDDGQLLVALGFGLTLYGSPPLSGDGKAVLDIYRRFLELCPKDALTFYASENMRQHKPIAKSTLNMLPTWLKPGAPAREMVSLQLKDGEQYQDAPRYNFQVFGMEKKSKMFKVGYASAISLGFPLEESGEFFTQMRDLFVAMCSVFPFRSGMAGLSFECSKYELETSQTHAWGLSMRHPGININRIVNDSMAVHTDAIKGVNWLTALSSEMVAGVGGAAKLRKALSREIEFIEVPHGIILQAGPAPAAGDLNRGDKLPLYRSVFQPLAPLVKVSAERTPSFNLSTDYEERTTQWFLRFEDA